MRKFKKWDIVAYENETQLVVGYVVGVKKYKRYGNKQYLSVITGEGDWSVFLDSTLKWEKIMYQDLFPINTKTNIVKIGTMPKEWRS